jgi:hypothetical protein
MPPTNSQPDGSGAGDSVPTEAERAALHDLELGLEHVYRGYGALLTFHHQVGRGMDRFDDARARLREAGHDDLADRLRDEVLPAGAVGDRWTYELVAAFRAGLLAAADTVESDAREALADGAHHCTERRQQRRWRERAAAEAWRTDGEPAADGEN